MPTPSGGRSLADIWFTAPPKGNEAYWRKKLANQGEISKPTKRLSDLLEEKTIGTLKKAGLNEREARSIGKKAFSAVNDLTPVGNITGADQGGSDVYQGLTRGDIGKASIGALTFALSVLPSGATAPVKRKLKDLIKDEAGAIRAWHGSPHDFDRFSLDKIGTGEGAQAYGHGLYFAENKGVADAYREQLGRVSQGRVVGGRSLTYGTPEYKAADLADMARGNEADIIKDYGSVDAWARSNMGFGFQDQSDDIMRLFNEYRGQEIAKPWQKGRLYEVNIDAEPEQFLDYDAPIADQPLAMEVLRNLDLDQTGALSRTKSMLRFVKEGKELPEYRTKGRELLNAVSNYGESRSLEHAALMPYGIKGVRYLDQGSRGAGQGSRNFVVYDDALIDILNRY